MISQGYNITTFDHCVFTRNFSDDDFIILLLYVDDMLIICYDSSKIDRLNRELSKSFAMKDLGSPMIGKIGSFGYLKKDTLRRFLKDST